MKSRESTFPPPPSTRTARGTSRGIQTWERRISWNRRGVFSIGIGRERLRPSRRVHAKAFLHPSSPPLSLLTRPFSLCLYVSLSVFLTLFTNRLFRSIPVARSPHGVAYVDGDVADSDECSSLVRVSLRQPWNLERLEPIAVCVAMASTDSKRCKLDPRAVPFSIVEYPRDGSRYRNIVWAIEWLRTFSLAPWAVRSKRVSLRESSHISPSRRESPNIHVNP